MTATIGFLHTSPVHVATFDSLVAETSGSVSAKHIVDVELLATARSIGSAAATEAIAPSASLRTVDDFPKSNVRRAVARPAPSETAMLPSPVPTAIRLCEPRGSGS